VFARDALSLCIRSAEHALAAQPEAALLGFLMAWNAKPDAWTSGGPARKWWACAHPMNRWRAAYACRAADHFDLRLASQHRQTPGVNVDGPKQQSRLGPSPNSNSEGKEMKKTAQSKLILLCAAACFTAFTVKAGTLVEGYGYGSSSAEAAQSAIDDAALTCEAIGSSLSFANIVASGYQFGSHWARAVGRCND
jgi:hypothetical protein